MVKTDSSGNIQWSQTYGGSDDDDCYCVVATSDGGYALAGWTHSFGSGDYDAWLIKVDSSGIAQWDKTYHRGEHDIITGLVQTSDGGYVLSGFFGPFPGYQYDAWLIKVDSSGNFEWDEIYGAAGDDRVYSMVKTGDGGYAMAGFTDSSGSYDAWLVKVDSTGYMEWSETYGGTDDDMGNSLIASSDGGFVIAGETSSSGVGSRDAWLVKVDSSGVLQWSNTYGGSNYDRAMSLVEVDNGYVVAGQTSSFGAGGIDSYLIKTDSSGSTLWSKTYGGSADESSWSIILTNKKDKASGYAIAGWTNSFGAGSYDFWFIRERIKPRRR